MPQVYDLGTLTVVNHDVEKLTDAFGIPEHRFDDILNLAREAWGHEDTISESIEYIAQRVHGSELVLTLAIFGRIWEENSNNEE
jgi:hypothetical protein